LTEAAQRRPGWDIDSKRVRQIFTTNLGHQVYIRHRVFYIHAISSLNWVVHSSGWSLSTTTSSSVRAFEELINPPTARVCLSATKHATSHGLSCAELGSNICTIRTPRRAGSPQSQQVRHGKPCLSLCPLDLDLHLQNKVRLRLSRIQQQ